MADISVIGNHIGGGTNGGGSIGGGGCFVQHNHPTNGGGGGGGCSGVFVSSASDPRLDQFPRLAQIKYTSLGSDDYLVS